MICGRDPWFSEFSFESRPESPRLFDGGVFISDGGVEAKVDVP